jgi:hypothetical protein
MLNKVRKTHLKLTRRPKEVLVYTLVVKNEADIIIDNIFFHYAKGVDHVIVTDNGSTDDTLKILKSLESEGLISLLQEKLYQQDVVVNKMGVLAKQEYRATILIHSDADEFWSPVHTDNLKKAFTVLNKKSVQVDRKDVLPTPESKNHRFPQKNQNIVAKHLISNNVAKDSKKTSLFLFRLPPKVMFSVKDELKEVGIGNHYLTGKDDSEVTNEIVIFHFPFKSAERFKEKVIIAGKTMQTIKTKKETWWHWKRWWQQYNDGLLDKEIDLLVPNLNSIKGVEFEPFDYDDRIIKPISSNTKLWKKYNGYKDKFNQEIGSN